MVKPLLFILILCFLFNNNAKAQVTCSLNWLNDINPAPGTLDNYFVAASTNISGRWKTAPPTSGSFATSPSVRPNYGSFSNTLLTSSRGGGRGAITTITFASPVDFYRLHIKDLRGDGILGSNSEAQKIEAYLNNVAVPISFSTSNASLVSINTSTNTINGSTTTNSTSQGEVMMSFAGAFDSLLIKSVGFNDFVIIDLICPDGLTSVNMSPVTYQQNNHILTLKWQTFSETNNRGFDIQESIDGLLFTTIGYVRGLNTPSVYFFSVTSTNESTKYYRLLQKNLDGSYTLSNIIKISPIVKGKKFWYNANNETLYFGRLENLPSSLQVYNSQSKLIRTIKINIGITQVAVRDLTNGVYFIVLKNEGKCYSQKILVLH